MNPEEQFALERLQRLDEFSEDARLKTIAHDWVFHAAEVSLQFRLAGKANHSIPRGHGCNPGIDLESETHIGN